MSSGLERTGPPILVGTTQAEFPQHPLRAESVPLAHHVALAWVVDPACASILLVAHRSRRWSCPGGHVDDDETLVDAARRELFEETGLRAAPLSTSPFTLGRLTGCPRHPGVETVHWAAGFLFVVDPDLPLVAEQGQPARWFRLDDLPVDRPTDVDTVVADLRAPA